MTTDRELLEAAAKAAGLKFCGLDPRVPTWTLVEGERGIYGHQRWAWSPLEDDGDALRLAVKLRFHVNIFSAMTAEGIHSPGFVEIWDSNAEDLIHTEGVDGGDYESATRRAIVRAAASGD